MNNMTEENIYINAIITLQNSVNTIQDEINKCKTKINMIHKRKRQQKEIKKCRVCGSKNNTTFSTCADCGARL